jgi:hypothetical protein
MHGKVKECKSSNPGSFILAKVDIDKLIVSARDRTDSGWEDLEKSTSIPLDILDPAEIAAAEDEVVDMITIS